MLCWSVSDFDFLKPQFCGQIFNILGLLKLTLSPLRLRYLL